MPRISTSTRRVVASLGIGVGVVLVALGINASVTGRDAQGLPDGIEDITPVKAARQVLSQERVEVDLDEGYTGVLIVNGVELETIDLSELETEPGQQVDLPPVTLYEPGNATLTFTPSEGAAIEEFTTGVNTVAVVYWKLTEGRNFAKPTFTWQFDVV